MKRTGIAVTIIFIIACGLMSCQFQRPVAQAQEPRPQASPVTPTSEIRCRQPRPEYVVTCRQWEEDILAATVRVSFSGWLASAEENTATWTQLETEVGHGTVMDGRYLVTHNHYQMPFDLVVAGRVAGLVSLFSSSGQPILTNADINIVSVVYQDRHTLVLAFQTGTRKGLFEKMGYPSAEFKSWNEVNLQAGVEVAQVDWDGSTAHVDWIEIQAVVVNEETPRVEMANFNALGSSGGGVFWQGRHIANNWQRTTVDDAGGTAVLHQWSTAALNSPTLLNSASAVAQATLTPGPAN